MLVFENLKGRPSEQLLVTNLQGNSANKTRVFCRYTKGFLILFFCSESDIFKMFKFRARSSAVERFTDNEEVEGSTPSAPTSKGP